MAKAKAPARDAAESEEFVYVKSALDGNRIALHEVDPRHPGGSVIVSGDKAEKVANTEFVRQRLRDRWLVEAAAGDRKEADKRVKEREEAAEEQGVDTEPVTGDDGAGDPDPRDWPGSEPTEEELEAEG